MNVQNLDIEHKRDAWRDWFIIDEPVKSCKLIIWIDRAFSFNIDPSFDYYKVSGHIDKDDPPSFMITYLFVDDDDMSIEKRQVSCFRKINDNTKYFEVSLKR
jgi:hypothetical protein